ncbi:MAG TPA: DNA/RNA nuclease SfsA [Syntrophales bacterium]|jgi:sugar fermentation stimulation protein A|nr:DNA/RNA nuclease SfsA [Syntrophales bacterium]HON22981.1 DNA/RNA nuclease SfsA [Syntrophales bacterium]HOU77477.1 DNA/RNA nuclease SfsA [Syntrophales bacterium]HPC31815.1 DNA/RNA nuclease SfsA [Syntrophales bacterium]HQG33494.1 DNA/RNA nuclease SfsA [Syntrophales bacterium]
MSSKQSADGSGNLFHEPLFPAVIPGRFRRRLNRFVIECDCGVRVVQAHLPNPGRLWELLVPGRTVSLVKNAPGPGHKTPYTAVAVERDGVTVLLHTTKTNDTAQFLLQERLVPGLEGAEILKREIPLGNSRFDFLLREKKERILLEVKSCTLYGRSLAMFPDAVTVRGRRHLTELATHAEKGRRCGVLFIVHSPGPEFFLPDYHTDYEFARTFQTHRNRLFYLALRISWRKDLCLNAITGAAPIPWALLEREARDEGCYILILTLTATLRIPAGNLGRLDFPAGYYLYVGSARKNLSARLAHHCRRDGQNLHRHIDCLRPAAASCLALPIRTQDDIECELAAAVSAIAVRTIPGFGSADCSCPGHLFFMPVHPLHSPEFRKLLQYYRMDRLNPF